MSDKNDLKLNIVDLSNEELESIGRIMVSEFEGELFENDKELLKKYASVNENPFFRADYFAPGVFEETRDKLINKVLTNSEEKNAILKKLLFPKPERTGFEVHTARLLQRGTDLRYNMENLMTRNSKSKYNFLRRSRKCSKEDILKQIKDIHKTSREEVAKALNIYQKTFIENLSEDEKEFLNISDQKEFELVLGILPKGFEKCFSSEERHEIAACRPIGWVILTASSSEDTFVRDPLRRSFGNKKQLFDELKEEGYIINEEQELLIKKELGDLLVLSDSQKKTMRENLIGNSGSSMGTR